MNQVEFIEAIKLVVINGSIKAVESNLENPPGRQPQQKLVELSNWFNGLSSQDKIMAKSLVTESVETGVFSFLCVLDGVSVIESTGEKGNLVLHFEKNGITTWLNNPDENYLHDLL